MIHSILCRKSSRCRGRDFILLWINNEKKELDSCAWIIFINYIENCYLLPGEWLEKQCRGSNIIGPNVRQGLLLS